MKSLTTVWKPSHTSILETDEKTVLGIIEYVGNTTRPYQLRVLDTVDTSEFVMEGYYCDFEIAQYAALVWYNNYYLLRKDN